MGTTLRLAAVAPFVVALGWLAAVAIETVRTEAPALPPGDAAAAIAHHTRDVERRPAWPHGWAALAEAQYRRGDLGPALEPALMRAVELGPAEPAVQVLVADYGLAVFDEVGRDAQAAIDRAVAAGMRRNPLEILRISERRGRLDRACRHLGDRAKSDPHAARLCPDYEITP
jgi:cytochrome c-type biogenesis protein CcmH/NrfG